MTISRSELVFGSIRQPTYWKPAHLTATQRDEIGFRRMDGDTVKALAAEYGVRTALIYACTPKERDR